MSPRYDFRVILRRSVDTSTTVMMTAAMVTLVAVYWKSPAAASNGINATAALILEITPLMLAAFTLAGLIQAVVPQEAIVKWMGQGSGTRGILIGMTLGSISPGGPMLTSPSSLPFFKVGIGIGPLVAYLTSLVSFRTSAYHHVGDSLSRGQSRGGTICREFFLSVPSRLAMRNALGKASRLSEL